MLTCKNVENTTPSSSSCGAAAFASKLPFFIGEILTVLKSTVSSYKHLTVQPVNEHI